MNRIEELKVYRDKVKRCFENIEKYNSKIKEIERELYWNIIPDIAKQVILDISKKHLISDFEITWKSRSRQVMKARREVCYILRNNYKYTLERIWDIFSRDHSDIHYLLRTYNKNL